MNPQKKDELKYLKETDFNYRYLQAFELAAGNPDNIMNQEKFLVFKIMEEFKDKAFKKTQEIINDMVSKSN